MKLYLGIDIGIRNMSFCVLGLDENGGVEIKRWELVDLLQGERIKSANKVPLVRVHSLLAKFLATHFPTEETRHTIHTVAIELQPQGRMTNTRMQIMSHLMLWHFRGMMGQGDTLKDVRFVDPKLKYSKGLMEENGITAKKGYAGRKANSIALCRALTTMPNPSGRKLDDLADSFLLAYVCAIGL